MIANVIENGWEIIYHRGHALLAAQLAGHWRSEDRPAQWVETVAAISHHDDPEMEWAGRRVTPAGTPLHFTQSKNSSVRYDVRQRDDSLVTVEPWPFDLERFDVTVEARCLSQAVRPASPISQSGS